MTDEYDPESMKTLRGVRADRRPEDHVSDDEMLADLSAWSRRYGVRLVEAEIVPSSEPVEYALEPSGRIVPRDDA